MGVYDGEGRKVISSRKMRSCDRRRHIMARGRAGIYVLSVLLLVIFCGISCAKDSDTQKSNQLIGVIAKLEKIRDNAFADIQKCEREIQRSESTIRRSEDIIRQAQQKGTAQAEMIARQALTTAQETKRKNEKLKQEQEWTRARTEEAIKKVNSMIDKLSKGETDEKSVEEAKELPDKIRRREASLCREIETQLERDKERIKRYQKTIEMNKEEAQKWADENKEAVKEAQKSAGTLLFEAIGGKLLENKKIAGHIQERLIDYKVKIAVEGPPSQKILADRLIKKIGGASVAYANAAAKADTGKLIEAGVDLKTYYDITKATVLSVNSAKEAADREMKEVLQTLKVPGNDLRENFSDLASLVAELKLDNILEQTPFLQDTASFALFLRDYFYHGTAWYQSRERILEYEKIMDEQLKAVKANQEQIKRTGEKLKACLEGGKTSGH